MKTKEEILKECQLSQPYQEGTWYKGAIEAMQLYSDQQNKELRERIAVVLSDSALGVEIQRLTTEKKELEEKLMSEQIENGYLQAFRVSNEAEIQRLTKEVEELKEDRRYWGREYTRLRELLRRSIPVLDRKNRYYTNLLADIDNKLKQ